MSHEIGSHECWHFLRPYAKNLQLLYAKVAKARRRRSSDPKRHLVFSLPCAVPFPYQTRKADFHHGSSAFAAWTPRCLGVTLYAAVFKAGCPMSSSAPGVTHPYRQIREAQNSACRSELSRERHQKSEEGIGGGAPNLH